MTENKILMEQARESLKGRWKLAVGVVAVWGLISIAVQSIPKAGGIFNLLITGPLSLGLVIFFLNLSRNSEVRFEQIFDGFKRYSTALGVHLLVLLYIVLWSLLLIVPGIIAALSYAVVFYITADNNPIGIKEALKRSKKMMDGYKWKLFCLGWRFFGWLLLSALTLGVGFLWLVPYVQTTVAKFYDDIKNREGVV